MIIPLCIYPAGISGPHGDTFILMAGGMNNTMNLHIDHTIEVKPASLALRGRNEADFSF